MNATRTLLLTLFLAQAALFRQYALRETVWAYPAANDQTFYLSLSYSLYQDALEHGLTGSVAKFLHGGHQTGFMLPLQGAVMQFFLGSNRLAMLWLNFGYFVLLETVFFLTARWLTGRTAFGWLGLGLLMLQQSAFFYAGGMFDFRIDFIASCLYGVFLCLLVRSDGLRQGRWLAAAVACGWLLVSFRFITFVYLFGFFGLLFAGLLLLRLVRPGGIEGSGTAAVAGLKRAVLLAAACLAGTLPLIMLNWQPIHDYYVIGHLTSAEKGIRAAEFGVAGLSGHLTYYLRSLATDHLGAAFLVLWAGLGAGAVVSWLVAARRRGAGAEPMGTRRSESAWWITLLILGAGILSPWVVLTANVSKSPVVASVLGAPLALLPILLLAGSRRRLARGRAAAPLTGAGWGALAAGVAVLGFGNWLTRLSAQGPFSPRRASVEQINALGDYLSVQKEQFGMRSPVISGDMISDWMNYLAMNVRAYERHGQWLEARGALNQTIFAVSLETVLAEMSRSDFVLLTDYPKAGVYPFYTSMRELQPQMRAWCDAHLIRGRQFPIDGGTVTAYVRPRVPVEGLSGEWITSEGVRLRLAGGLLAWLRETAKSSLVLEGDDHLAWLKKPPTAVARAVGSQGTPVDGRELPASFEQLSVDRYRVRLDLKELLAGSAARDEVVISLKLENAYFVPKEMGMSGDTRQLVVMQPSIFGFE